MASENSRYFTGSPELFEDTTTFWNGSGNSTTDSGGELDPTLLTIYNVLIIAQVSFLMMTVGTATTFDGLKAAIRRPKGLIIGLSCQLLLMPLLCFTVAHALQMEPPLAIGLIVVSSCPGGAPSNLFTLLAMGDIPLSVALTAFSSILTLATMPLNVFLYTRSWADLNLAVSTTPYINILIGVVFTWAPALVGMLLRRRFPKKAPLLTRVSSLSALAALTAFFFLNRVLFPGVFSLRWGVWYAAITMPLLGWLFAFGVAMVFQCNREQRRAIAFGTCLVNGGLGVSLISLTYDGVNDLEDMLQFPMLYMSLQIVDAILIVGTLRIYFCARDQTTCCQRVYFKATGKIPHSQREKIEELVRMGEQEQARYAEGVEEGWEREEKEKEREAKKERGTAVAKTDRETERSEDWKTNKEGDEKHAKKKEGGKKGHFNVGFVDVESSPTGAKVNSNGVVLTREVSVDRNRALSI